MARSRSTTRAKKPATTHKVIKEPRTADKGIKEPTTTDELIKEPTTTEKLIKELGRTMITIEIKRQLNAALQKSFPPYLENEFCLYKRLDEARLKKYGDYMCYNILRICEILRLEDPSLFKHTSPKAIAKKIMKNFEASDMIKGLTLVDIGFLTFKINGEWMVQRIEKNLKDGIVAWAPIATIKRAIVDLPAQDIDAEKHADGVRSYYIRETLVRMLEYSGVAVSGKIFNDQFIHKVKKYFPEEQGTIRKKGKSLFVIKEKASPEAHSNNVHEDLAALWCGIYEQKADWIVYVTPVRQRDYIIKCFTAAEGYYEVEDFAADRDFKNEDRPTMSYLGYQTSGGEQEKLYRLWRVFQIYKRRCDLYAGEGMMAYGYSPEEVFECLIKYAYLKTHIYSECAFDVKEEMDYTQGNTFLHLLDARKKIRSVIEKNSSSRDLFKLNKALIGKEREFGLHLLQFTEVIQEAFSTLMPHLLCEYLFKLSENFTGYILEAQPSETRVLLCKAAEVVMEKGFDLLGITPKFSKGLTSYLRPQTGKAMAIRDHYISNAVSRPNSSSRFELFSMFIGVTPSDFGKGFETGELFGYITVSDTCGLLSDGWCFLDKNGCGHVAHFVHDFDNSVGIRDTCFLPFGNPGSRHSVACSDSIKMGVHLFFTTKKKDACYQLCSCDHDIELGDFWDGTESVKRNTFSTRGINGCVSISYILIKDAVDTSWSLWYEPEPTMVAPKLHGQIVAYYGDDNDMSYEAVMFHSERCNERCKLEKGNLKLKRSTLAVPANETLVIKAFLQDDDSGEVIVNETIEYVAKPKASSIRWLIEGKNCRLELIVVVTVDGKNCS
ncbi:arginine--tRNA ligase, chloroplastic/mitochondrial [Tanacetum coccineum]